MRRNPTPHRALPRRLAAGLCCVALGCAAAGSAPTPLDIDVRARARTPGEPLRIEVRSPAPLRAVKAEFLGERVHLSRDGDALRWTGWAMIGLDQPPGPATIDVRGTTDNGRAAAGSLTLDVEAREFPVERLDVASKYVTPPPEVQERLKEERRALAAIYRVRRDAAAPRRPFVRPVPGEQNSVFGTRRILNGEPRSPHPGVDLRGAEGTPVKAAGAGRVVMARELYYSGNIVILDHGGGMFTLYAHLSRIDTETGRDVEAGEQIGLVGATGRVTGPHLHWGAKIGNRPFDPTALLDPVLFE